MQFYDEVDAYPQTLHTQSLGIINHHQHHDAIYDNDIIINEFGDAMTQECSRDRRDVSENLRMFSKPRNSVESLSDVEFSSYLHAGSVNQTSPAEK